MTLTQTERITVIITTHYIEEARQAHVVGLMRHGRLLAEASPEDLLVQHNLETLEEVFLKLCMTDSSQRAAALAGGASMSTLAVDSQQDIHKSVIGEVKNGQADPKYQSAMSVYSSDSTYTNPSGGNNMSTINLVDSKSAPRPKGARYEAKVLTLGEYWSTTTALFWKNFTRLRRNIP